MTELVTDHARPVDGSLRLTATVAAATFLVLAAYTAALPTLTQAARAVGAGPDAQTWILGGMSVGLAAALLLVGTVADVYGRRRVLAAGTAGLAAACGLNALAPTTAVLIAARLLEGVAGAAILTAGLGLIGHELPAGPLRTRGTALWGAMIGAGIAAGPAASAALAAAASWRTVWWTVVIAAVVVTPLVGRLPETRSTTPRRLDVRGAITFAMAMLCSTAGLTLARAGWARPVTVVLLTAGATLLVAFLLVERSSPDPLIDLSLFRRPLFLASASGALLTGLGLIALMSFLPVLAQRALGQSALGSAGTLAVWSATSWIVAMQTHRLPARLTSPMRLAAGFVLCASGVAAVSGVHADAGWLRLAPGLFIAGVGSGIANAALGRLAIESVPIDRTAMGSAANNTARYLGGAAGVAMVVAIVGTGHGASGAAALVDGWNHAAHLCAALCALAAVIALACERLGARAGHRLHRA